MSAVNGTPLQQALVDIFSDAPLVTLEQNVDRALRTITQQLKCGGVFVLSSDFSGKGLKPRNLYVKAGAGLGGNADWPLARMPYFRRLMRTPKLLNLTDINDLPQDARQEKQFLREQKVKSLLVLPPLVFGDTQIAVGAVNYEQPRSWDETFISELQHAQALIGAAMELTRIARELLKSERRYQDLFNQLPLACGVLDSSDKLTMLNKVARLNMPLAEDHLIYELVSEEKHDVLRETIQVVREGRLSQAWCELPIVVRPNTRHWLKLNFSRIQDSDNLVIMAEDVSEQHRLADELSFHANYDTLTGLPNRLHFEAMLEKLLKREEQVPVCIAFVDLDQFQVVNNISGHIAGDKLVCQIAMRLKQLVRKGDLVARLGGDEFGILMHYCNPESAKMIARRICQQIESHEFSWEGKQHRVTASLGMAMLDPDARDIYNVMTQADVACRLAKEQGRNGWHFYNPADPKMLRLYGEMAASVDLVSALADDRFELYFQPIVPLLVPETGMHLEVLLRLPVGDGEMLSPGVFLPAAERYSLAPRIDRWVVDNLLLWAADHLSQWQQLALVSVNLSATSLQDEEFMTWLELRLMSEPELVDKLCFEITETAAVSQIEVATRLIELLKPLGCKLALDDFGSGFSSFAYLKELDVDFVKIDGQFIQQVCNNAKDKAIVNAICQLAREMHFQTIAEFVEDDAIATQLARVGVDYAQGFAIARPRPLAELDIDQPPASLHISA
ncbi:putative bifunctional diguanylate cyclase/phosphodiesterase [Shewanella sp. GXUN23E]|uniref:putative bifunctional diguanylate cyclase/phosphodiesterase n=1 Tax=Shewanella sp. GXUN23E TaxID=3422498 RepID=UPI003D7C95D0